MENNKKLTDEERLELAAKLDRELDDFIDGLKKTPYTDGWPEDRWQEEMDKHPFFMKKAPQPGDPVHPLFEGLQKLKYDPNENSAEELAMHYKEDGNFYLKHKKFRTAVYSFTEGIKAKCDNPHVNAILYNNRSAAQFFLKNYRSSLTDAQKALELEPDYSKPKWRAAQCAFHINKFDLCNQVCTELLEQNPQNAAAQELMKNNKAKKLETERNKRKEILKQKKELAKFQHLTEILQRRGIKFDEIEQGGNISETLLHPIFLSLEDHQVHIENDILIWPAVFSYPEFLKSDFQQNLNEDATMEDVLDLLLSPPLPYDEEGKYRPDSVNVYYENRKAGKLRRVDVQKCIGEIIEEKDFYVSGGSLLFFIVVKDSSVEKDFIKQKRRPNMYK